MEKKEFESLAREQLAFLKTKRLVSAEEEASVEYLINNYDKICYPSRDWVNLLEWERQHKVPKFFLNWFSDWDNCLYQYDLKTKEISWSKIPTKSVLTEEDFYVIPEKDWKKSYFFEKFIFAHLLERELPWVLEKIKNKIGLVERDWQILSWFISFQYVRTDFFVNNTKESFEMSAKIHTMHGYDSFEKFESRAKFIEKETGKDLWNKKSLYEFMKSGNYDVLVDRQSIMKDVLSIGKDFREAFINWHYEVLETNKSNFFLISDNPFFMIPPKWWEKWQWLWLLFPPTVEKIIPINKKQCLRIRLEDSKSTWVSLSYRTINHKETNRINEYICKNATRFILSKDSTYLSNLIKNIDFQKVNEEKEYNKFIYDDKFKIQIVQQLYPL